MNPFSFSVLIELCGVSFLVFDKSVELFGNRISFQGSDQVFHFTLSILGKNLRSR